MEFNFISNRFNSTKAATVRIEKNTTITCEDGMYGKDMIDMFGHYDKNETIYLKNKAVLTFKDANVFVSFPAGTDIAGIRGATFRRDLHKKMI